MKKHRWMNDDTDELMLALLELKNLAEARAFFGDLFTEKEIKETANRWKVAKMLDFGVGFCDNFAYSKKNGRRTWWIQAYDE